MQNKANLYAIYGLSHSWDDEPFDQSKLPAPIVPSVTIENVALILNRDAFDLFDGHLSRTELQALRNVKYAIVHRYQTGSYLDEKAMELESGEIVYKLASCLRLIRPMRQSALRIHGTFKADGTLEVGGFDHPVNLMEVPNIQKSFSLRNRDVDELQKIAAAFLSATTGEYWKFRMPLSLHEPAHFIDKQWKARMSLLCSAIESIYTSQTPDREHSGSRLAKARIKWFLGKNTPIYAAGDVPSFMSCTPHPTVGEILDDLYEIRNCIAHGDKIPDKYFIQLTTSYRKINELSVLEEAASFIVRTSLLRILKDDLLPHFKGGTESQMYFASNGLVRSKLSEV